MSWSEPAYADLARLLSTRTGLAITPDRCASIEQGIRRAMAQVGVADVSQYHRLIESNDAALDGLITDLTIGETYFFREPAQFQFLRHTVLPEIRSRRGPDHVIRVWSAGCASGEEAYSLAIVLAEAGLAERAYLLATDISRVALAKARQGLYSAWSLRGEGADAARSYLHRQNHHYLVDEALRRRVVFEYQNLALDVYPSFATGIWGMDVILCRNVLIYFHPETIPAVARRLFASLADGGWLFTASSDPPLASAAPFETVVTDQGVFYRRGVRPAEPKIEVPRSEDLLASFGADPELLPTRRPRSTEPPRPHPMAARASPARPRLEVWNSNGAETAQAAPAEALAATREALARGDYALALAGLRDQTADADTAAVLVRAQANLSVEEAERACAAATARHPLSKELHYLWAVLLLNLGRDPEALREARRAIYLDRSLVVASFTLGLILQRRGDQAGAWRAYRNVGNLCAAHAADEVAPLSDGETYGQLAQAAEAQLALLQAHREVPR